MSRVSELGLSIGALSRATGIPGTTLRTWERRYGVPRAERLPSGHRRYPVSAVEELVQVRELLGRGHRASDVLPASPDERDALMALAERRVVSSQGSATGDVSSLEAWLDAVYAADAGALERLLRAGWDRDGCVRFLDEQLSPFLVEVGHRWARGALDIGAEHFCSQVVAHFLSSRWRAARPRAGAPVAVCAGLSSERHALGLHMSAAVLALESFDVRFLGPDTPVSAIATAAGAQGAGVVCIGSSPGFDTSALAAGLVELRARIGPSVCLWMGGAPLPPRAVGAAVGVSCMGQLASMCADHARAARTEPRHAP